MFYTETICVLLFVTKSKAILFLFELLSLLVILKYHMENTIFMISFYADIRLTVVILRGYR